MSRYAAIEALTPLSLQHYIDTMPHLDPSLADAFSMCFAVQLMAKQALVYWDAAETPQLHLITREETLVLPYTEAQFKQFQENVGTHLGVAYCAQFYQAMEPLGLMSHVLTKPPRLCRPQLPLRAVR